MLVTDDEIATINEAINILGPLRDGHEFGKVGLRSLYNITIDNLKVLESQLRVIKHRQECNGCDSNHHIGQKSNQEDEVWR
jgi:hypothetical protein